MNKFDRVYRSIIKEANEGTSFNRKKANFDSIVQKINQVFRKYHIKNRSWTSQWGKQKYNNIVWEWEGLHGKNEHLMLTFEIHTGKATWEKGLRSDPLDLSTDKSAQWLIDRYINEKYWEELKWDKEEREIEEKQEKQKEEEQKRKKAAQWEAQQREYRKGLERRKERERRKREEWWNTVGRQQIDDEVRIANFWGDQVGAMEKYQQWKKKREQELKCDDVY